MATLVSARSGAPFIEVGLNLVEVEHFVLSDGTMMSYDQLSVALPTLAHLHHSLLGLDLDESGRSVEFANYVPPGELVHATRAGTTRIRSWGPTAEELALADRAERLADAASEANEPFGGLRSQLGHGDFWDDNVRFRGGYVALVADLEFMCERLRIDDLALTLYFASFNLSGLSARAAMKHLARLVSAYNDGARTPLSALERAALPAALARQPLWSIAVWAARLDDECVARRHIRGHLAAVERGLDILSSIERWQVAFQ